MTALARPSLDEPPLPANSNSPWEALRTEIKLNPLWAYVSVDQQTWYDQQIDQRALPLDSLKAKLEFYLKAAQTKHRILSRVPANKKAEVAQRLDDILNTPSHGLRQQKDEQLAEAERALDLFEANQKLVENQVQQIQHLPNGLKNRIWERFFAKFQKLTDGDILNPQLMENFRQSVQTTFTYLAKVLAMQAEMKQKIAQEKYFATLDESSKQSLATVMSTELEAQLQQWLRGDLSLKDWHKKFEDLSQKRTPKNLREFNQYYNQVFTEDFWQAQKHMQPMHFPNFTQAFNFSQESDFLHHFSLQAIKKMPTALKKALMADVHEITSEFFGPQQAKAAQNKVNSLSPQNPAEIINVVLSLLEQREKQEAQAKEKLKTVRLLLHNRDPQGAKVRAESLEQQFGPGIWKSLRAINLRNTINVQCAEIQRLEKKLTTALAPQDRKKTLQQLKRITDQDFGRIDSGENSTQKLAALQQELEGHLKTKNFGQAHRVVNKVYALDALAGYKALKKVEAAEHAAGVKPSQAEDFPAEKVDISTERQVKIRFFERCIEHAQKVMEACDQMGIPRDDPKFWGPEGIKNRVAWLKQNGLYSRYEAYNRSDPNIPSQAQNGGFRFRWMDGRGNDNLNLGKAQSGIKYMDRYKESGYALCALAGSFSINWKGSSSPTYTPEKFISLIQAEISKV